jgi:hypothetical protein
MKKLVLPAVVAFLAAISCALAAESDMRLGSFEANWCNYPARFDIQSREGSDWVFHGRVLIQSTGQYDPLWIEQYADNSLRIIRYLQGPDEGATQVVQTYGPEVRILQGQRFSQFRSQSSYGYGCEHTQSWVKIPE